MKKILKMLGIIAIAAVIGCAMAGCTLEEDKDDEPTGPVTIIINNSSSATTLDQKVDVSVHNGGSGEGNRVGPTKTVSLNSSVTYHVPAGSYRVRVVDGIGFVWNHPYGGSELKELKADWTYTYTYTSTSVLLTKEEGPGGTPTTGTIKIKNDISGLAFKITEVTITRSSGGTPVVNQTVSISPSSSKDFEVPAGTYLVEVMLDDNTDGYELDNVTVTAGQTKTLSLTYDGGDFDPRSIVNKKGTFVLKELN